MSFIQAFYTPCLSQASYYVEDHGQAAVLDPLIDVEPYLALARKRGATICWVLETHFHADFISGHLELSRAARCPIVFGPDAKPQFPALVAEHNELLHLGQMRIRVLHTPGHTLESSCYLLEDRHHKPIALFTGDTLLNGDVGRPDLLSGNLNKVELATRLFHSLHKVLWPLPDHLVVYPGHGAGSACGKHMGDELETTLGEQKRINYALKAGNLDTFVEVVTRDLPMAPAYFAEDARLNREGYPPLKQVLESAMQAFAPDAFLSLKLNPEVIVIDSRNAEDFGHCHVPGSVNIGLSGDFAVWAGSLLTIDQRILLVCEPGTEREASVRLARVGFHNILGHLEGGLRAWQYANLPTERIDSLDGLDVAYFQQTGEVVLVDVRKDSEVRAKGLRRSVHIPLSDLPHRLIDFDPLKTYLLCCVGGYRSMIAASLLRRSGIIHVMDVRGGVNQLQEEYPEALASNF